MPRTGRVVFSQMEDVQFGVDAATAVAATARRFGANRVFLMASGTLNRDTDVVHRIREALGNTCAGLFDRMRPHTPRPDVIAASEQARAAGADLLVTIGGGSITDAGKAVQLCLANDVRTPESMDRLRSVMGADGAIGPPPCAPPTVRQVSVPTTLSAGEFSAVAGVTDLRIRVKELFRHPRIIPVTVILDPVITAHTPEWLFISTGIRAVDHCVEGICSREAHPFADAQALHALSLLTSGLARVKAAPSDREARLNCQIGAWLSMAPIATGVPMGASHGIGYVLGAAFDVPHGHTSCIMLPSVMRWNRPANADRQKLVSAAMGEPLRDAADLLDAFIRDLGMPRSLGAVGIGAEHFANIAEQAMATAWIPRNPRPIDGPAQLREILELAA